MFTKISNIVKYIHGIKTCDPVDFLRLFHSPIDGRSEVWEQLVFGVGVYATRIHGGRGISGHQMIFISQ